MEYKAFVTSPISHNPISIQEITTSKKPYLFFCHFHENGNLLPKYNLTAKGTKFFAKFTKLKCKTFAFHSTDYHVVVPPPCNDGDGFVTTRYKAALLNVEIFGVY